jgi:RNA polymerase sigma factor (sigma-70 family)
MEKGEYIQAVINRRVSVEKILMKNLPKTKESAIIHEDLITLYLCKVLSKVNFLKIKDQDEALSIFKRQAKDVKYDYFRSNAKRGKNILKEVDLENLLLPDHSQNIVEEFEQKDIINKIIDQLSNSEIQFLNIALLQGRSYTEVSSMLNISIVAVRKKISRLRAKLANVYERIKNN